MRVVVLVLVSLSARASEAGSRSLFSSFNLGHVADGRLITPSFSNIVSWLPDQGIEEKQLKQAASLPSQLQPLSLQVHTLLNDTIS